MSTIKTWQENLEEFIGDGQITTSSDVQLAMQCEIDALREALKVAHEERNEALEADAATERAYFAIKAKLDAIEAQEPVAELEIYESGKFDINVRIPKPSVELNRNL